MMKYLCHIILALGFILIDHSPVMSASDRDNQTDTNESAQESGTPEALTLSEALMMAMSRNHQLKVQTLDPSIKALGVESEKARFDPIFKADISASDRIGKQIFQTGALGDSVVNRSDIAAEYSDLSKSGTQTTFGLTTNRNRSAKAPNLFNTRIGLDITQPLQQGSGRRVNLIGIQQACIDSEISLHELSSVILNFIASVERKYWGLFLARKELEIVSESLRLANMQLDETKKRIDLGSIPESELAAAEAETALREEAVINAQSRLEIARISLLRLINPNSKNFWKMDFELVDQPEFSDIPGSDPEPHIKAALDNRPEILQTRLLIEKGELDIIRSKNGLLPKLDFYVSLGKSGYAQSFADSTSNLDQKSYDLAAGIRYEIPLNRRAARTSHERALLTMEQSLESEKNLVQLIQEDVLTAYFEAKRAYQQIHATAKTVDKQVEKLRIETTKFNLGKTTAFQVAQAQRDLTAAQISELEARIGYINAVTELFRVDGTLSERRGFIAGTGNPADRVR